MFSKISLQGTCWRSEATKHYSVVRDHHAVQKKVTGVFLSRPHFHVCVLEVAVVPIEIIPVDVCSSSCSVVVPIEMSHSTDTAVVSSVREVITIIFSNGTVCLALRRRSITPAIPVVVEPPGSMMSLSTVVAA